MCALVVLAIGCGDDGGAGESCAALLPGDLVITEVLSDPAGADDGGEWFEVFNASNQSLTLEGLTLLHSRGDGSMRHTMTVGAVTIGAGEYFVFGSVLAELVPGHRGSDWFTLRS